MLKIDKQNRFKASVLALALAIMPLGAEAAGLGKLTVMSALGQPLRAEIDLTASREEYSSLTARLASADAFKKAGVEYVPALAGIRVAPATRPGGEPYLLMTSDRPFNEPFVDVLLEVNWAAGRLVREYTFLLDPPDVFAKPAAPAPVAVPEVKKETAPPVVVPPKEAEAPPAVLPSRPAAEIAQRPAAKKSVEEGARTVKKGETLAKIAVEVKPEGVSLDQMLVALFRGNAEAFDGGNMNRLRAGKILNVPDKEAAAAVEPGEARKIVIAQASDFNAYRKKLAAVAAAEPAKEQPPKQAAAGKITPKVEEKAPPPPAGKDKLEVSRTEAAKSAKLGAKLAAAEEDLVARDKALKEANSRIAQLEKNLADLKKLVEMKSAAGAKVQEAAKPAPVLAVPAKPVEPPKPAEPAAKPAEPAPAAPPAAKKPAPTPTPPPPPPSFVEENPGLVFGGGGILALLLGYLGYKSWRKKRDEAEDAPSVAAVAPSSVFGTTDAHSIDTGAALPTDFSQESVAGAASDEGVDPVQEADVYMAYGRDSQAEEILLEALKTDPTRRAIHLKLLELYAARKSTQQFETVARDLHGLTAGEGPDWAKATALGHSIDPANPLYGASEAPAASAMNETVIMQAPAAVAETAPAEPEAAAEEAVPGSLDFDLDLGAEPEPAAEAAAPAPEAAPSEEEVMSLDFDLDLGAEPAAEPAAETAAAPAPEAPAAEPAAEEAHTLDFDLGTPAVAAEEAAAEPAVELPASGGESEVAALNFDFNLGDTAAPVETPAPAAEPEVPLAELEMPAVEFEAPAAEPAAAAEPETPALDLSAISLELEAPAAAEPAAAEPAEVELAMPELPMEAETPAEPEPVAAPPAVEDDAEVATKLELAQAYEEMGDKEGARELLNEVIKEGSPSQQQVARDKLAQLG